MKINWGTGIVIAMALFMSFILYFVIKAQSNSKYDNGWLSKNITRKDALWWKMVRVQNAQDLNQNCGVQKKTAGDHH
jgi:hypothetical protein